MDNQQVLLHHLLQKYLVEKDINFISVNLRCLLQIFSWVTYLQRVGGKLPRLVYLCTPPPHPRISERLDNQQISLHHVLQKYLDKRDINFISVSQRCLLPMLSWVTYLQGVGAELSLLVYLDPHPEFHREWIMSKLYYTIYFRNI